MGNLLILSSGDLNICASLAYYARVHPQSSKGRCTTAVTPAVDSVFINHIMETARLTEPQTKVYNSAVTPVVHSVLIDHILATARLTEPQTKVYNSAVRPAVDSVFIDHIMETARLCYRTPKAQ